MSAADFFAAFLSAGADMKAFSGTYQSRDGDEVAITFLLDNEAVGESGDGLTRVVVRRWQVQLLTEELEAAGMAACVGDVVTGSDGRAWRLRHLVDSDQDDITVWAVAPIPAEGS
jgi:hypothetical protein